MKKLLLIILISCCSLLVAAELYISYFTNFNEPYFDKKTKIIKRVKNTSGKYKTEYTNTGYFKINNEGWNSHRDYTYKRVPDKFRIAIIGHSNIEGLRVPVNKTISKVLEDKVLMNNINCEVYTFGFAGMHLAQALHVSRHVMNKYHPDLVIIGTLSDDFFADQPHHPYFLSLRIERDSSIREIAPNMELRSNSHLSFLYFLKTIKYIDLRFHIGKRINRFLGKGKDKTAGYNYYFSVKDSVYRYRNFLAIQYLLKEFQKLQQQSQKQILFLAFPLQVPSFNSQYLVPDRIESYFAKVIELIKKDFHVINLEGAFIDDYKVNRKRFDFPGDRHYNEYAHQLIGKILSDYIVGRQLIR